MNRQDGEDTLSAACPFSEHFLRGTNVDENALQLQNISKYFGSVAANKNIDLALKRGEILALLGENGSGKTTLLKAICGILPHSGSCVLEGRVLEGLRPGKLAGLCSYIPQRSGISIDISALDVVLMGFNPQLGLLERPSGEMKRKACQALERVGLMDRKEENYLHFSEGQKQLCVLARALAAGGDLLLLDEPESALDFRYR